MPGAVSLADGFVEGVREACRDRDVAPAPRANQPVAARVDVDPAVPRSAARADLDCVATLSAAGGHP
jgi:hypothetical protein